MHPGNAFAKAYDLLDAEQPIAVQLSEWSEDPTCRAASREATAALDLTGTIPSRLIDGASPPALLGVLSAIDRVLSRASPNSLPADPLTRKLRDQFLRHGKYNEESDGAVLPRYVAPGRPRATAESLDEVFLNARVSQKTWDRCQQINLHRPALQHLDINVPRSRLLHVAQIPLAAPTEIVLEHAVLDPDVNVYTATPHTRIHDRVPAAMHLLRESRAHLGLIPESTLTNDTLATWRATAHPDNPAWVLIGTGLVTGDQPGASAPAGNYRTATGTPVGPNRAVLMHGPTGEIIAVQDKRHGFTVMPDMRDEYSLQSAPDTPLGEGIVQGKTLTIIESRIGRAVILVCEDLDHLTQDGPMLRELGVSLVLVPIVAPPIVAYRWQHQASRALASDVGSTVITINSVALGRLETVEDPDTRENIQVPAVTLQVIVPQANSYKTHRDAQPNPLSESQTPEEDAMTVRTTTLQVP